MGSVSEEQERHQHLANLLLVCHELIDDDKEGVVYSADLLKRWKEEHEARVRVATEILPSKRSHVVFCSTRVGEEQSPLDMGIAYDAMFPD